MSTTPETVVAESDAELVLAFRERGRSSAYAELVRRYQIRLFRLLLGLIAGGDEAELVCEDMFVKAARDLVDLADPAQFYPWLAQRAQSAAEVTPVAGGDEEGPLDPRGHVLHAVRAALDTMSPDMRTALILSELQRDPPESVARTMGRPLEEVMDLIRGARARFVAEVSQVETGRAEGPRTQAPSVKPGMTIDGRYKITELIGFGGHGAVYRAEHLGLGRDVALKVLRPEAAAHEVVRERFRREALVLGKVEHERFVDVIDFGETSEGLLFLALEFLDGRSLSELIEQGPLPVEQALRITRDVLTGLAHLHSQEIVHRDMKPDNVILLEHDGELVPKILDLGIAKLLTSGPRGPGEDANLTRANMLLGTPSYMSPNQSAGDPVDGRDDLYSVAVVLFEMLTGSVPFSSKYVSAVLTMHISKAPPTLSSARMPTPPGEALEALVAKGLAKLPEARFQTAGEMRDAVDRLLDQT